MRFLSIFTNHLYSLVEFRARSLLQALIISTLFLLSFQLGVKAAPSDDIEMGEALLNFKYQRYHAAANLFEKVVNRNPRNANAHLFLAKCYVELKDTEAAKAEYDVVFHLNPFSEAGKAARTAMLDLSSQTEASNHDTDSPEIFKQTIRQIDRQTTDAANRNLRQAEINANRALSSADMHFASMGINRRQAMAMINQGMYVQGADISNMSYLSMSWLIHDAPVQALNHRRDGALRARFLEESALSLKQQLSEPIVAGRPHLRALGTSLYVRYYGGYGDDDIAPQDPILELKATAQRLADLPPALRSVQGPKQNPVQNPNQIQNQNQKPNKKIRKPGIWEAEE